MNLRKRLVTKREVRGGGGLGEDWELGITKCKLLHMEWI